MTAYVLIQTEPEAGPLARRLRSIPGVVSADDINGAYDAIALARSGSTRQLAERIVAEIRRLPAVTRVLVAPLIDRGTSDPQREADRLWGNRTAAA